MALERYEDTSECVTKPQQGRRPEGAAFYKAMYKYHRRYMLYKKNRGPKPIFNHPGPLKKQIWQVSDGDNESYDHDEAPCINRTKIGPGTEEHEERDNLKAHFVAFDGMRIRSPPPAPLIRHSGVGLLGQSTLAVRLRREVNQAQLPVLNDDSDDDLMNPASRHRPDKDGHHQDQNNFQFHSSAKADCKRDDVVDTTEDSISPESPEKDRPPNVCDSLDNSDVDAHALPLRRNPFRNARLPDRKQSIDTEKCTPFVRITQDDNRSATLTIRDYTAICSSEWLSDQHINFYLHAVERYLAIKAPQC
ncbi:hypothetical protein KEM56_005033 [Ascosphaera pollenicola]|nr:hypothetical protein KEM56_005033 [Ascosphaera pollenicola]